MENSLDNFYARKSDNGDLQLLSNHLENVSNLASSFSSLANMSKLIGILHDIGKATNGFQDYLINGGRRGSVPHSLQGAFVIDDIKKDGIISKLIKEIAQMIIASHHGQLPDGLSIDGTSMFHEKLERKNEDKYFFNEIQENLGKIINQHTKYFSRLFDLSHIEIKNIIERITKNYKDKKSAEFALGLLVKYLYSCLIDADWLDSFLFASDNKQINDKVNWEDLIEKFELNISKFKINNEISMARHKISNECKNASTRPTGIYQLSVPTGGGKTLSSMRFALYHTYRHNKKRIIYVIPYLSIIEQTARTLRDILNLEKESPIILEHHSNITQLEIDEHNSYRRQAISRWDSPIIITTMVQFLETVMSSRGGSLRKFHNMEDSIIIFDEIQFLPTNSIHLFNEVVTFLSKVLNTTIILCTATQPLIEKTVRKNLLLADNPHLINNASHYFNNLRRTNVVVEKEMDISGLAGLIHEKIIHNTNCLVIVNTRKTALDLYSKVAENIKHVKVFHLSTSMCPNHRSDVFREIKECLSKKEKIICISTQLIEAGVDISFSCVIRAMAGMDSILQAAGRCNRHGESSKPQNVYVVPLKNENLDKLQEIKIGKELSQRVYNEFKGFDYLDQKILDTYYEYYFYQMRNIMDFPTKNTSSVYEMLSTNITGKNNYKNITGKTFNKHIGHAFATADESFYVIAKNSQPVVVYYDESEKLIEDYKKSFSKNEKLRIIKQLEKYSVSLYKEYEFKILSEMGAITVINDEFGIQILDKKYYNESTGVVLKINAADLII